jgi:hypothetical protein
VTVLLFLMLEILAVLVVIYLRVTSRNRNDVPRPLVILPASAFPKQADVYECDDCNRDIAKHLHAGRAHVWQEMGPERFQCACGREYRTGAKEWDHLGDWEWQNRISQIIMLGVLFSAMASVLGLVSWLLLHFVFGFTKGAVVAGLVITALPFVLLQASFWPFVAASIWRTRFGKSVAYGRK